MSSDYKLQMFYGPLSLCKLVIPHLTSSPLRCNLLLHLSWSSIIPYVLPPSTSIHGILPGQFTCLTVFFHNQSRLAWHPLLHTPYISSSKHCLLFAAHAHTIATCFAVVQRLCQLILTSVRPYAIIHTLLQTNKHTSTSSLFFYRPDAIPDIQPKQYYYNCDVNKHLLVLQVLTAAEEGGGHIGERKLPDEWLNTWIPAELTLRQSH